jgi:hypothetical protein
MTDFRVGLTSKPSLSISLVVVIPSSCTGIMAALRTCILSSRSIRSKWYSPSFLYADPTPNALQVFLKRPRMAQADITGLPQEQGSEEGVWITADPIPGCVVCNIGESKPRDP